MNVVYVDNPEHIGDEDEKWSPSNRMRLKKHIEKNLFYDFQRTKITTDKLTVRTH